jgi:glycosyltransferase involved in cell wall biosynthesis
VQTHLVALHEFLQRRRVPCSVINITRHRKPQGDGIYYPRNGVELIRLLARLRYDVIHLHFGGNLTPRLLALTLVCCAMPRAKAILTFHSGGYPLSPIGRAATRRTLRGFVLRRLDRVVGVNAELMDMFRRFGVAPSRLRLIPPYALPASASASSDGIAFPNGFHRLHQFFEAHDPVLLTVGGLEPEYGIPAQVEMLGLLRQTFTNAGLAIIGGGSMEAEIRANVAAKDYSNHVLVCGDVPHAATLTAISKCDLMLRITHYDGDSIAVREALSAGTPVLATDNGMRPDGVSLVSSMEPAAVALAVTECLRGSARPPKIAQADDRNLEAILELYFELKFDHERVASSAAARG